MWVIYLSLVFKSNSIATGLTRISYQVLCLIKDTLLLASVATCDRKHRTTTDWIEFITSDTTCNGNLIIWLSILRIVDIEKVVQVYTRNDLILFRQSWKPRSSLSCIVCSGTRNIHCSLYSTWGFLYQTSFLTCYSSSIVSFQGDSRR